MTFNPSVLLWHDKYNVNAYKAGTQQQLYDSAIKILKSRLELGYILDPKEDDIIITEKPKLTKDQAEELFGKIPDNAYNLIIKGIEDYEKELKHHLDEIEQYKFIKEVIKNNDGKMAVKILYGRSEYEYERIEILELE